MTTNASLINKLERGRAEFAYKCVSVILELNTEDTTLALTTDTLKKFKEVVLESLKASYEKQIRENVITEEKIKEIVYKFSHIKDTELPTGIEKDIYIKCKNLHTDLLKNFRSYARKIPQMILSNGLGQTLAFVKAKAKDGNAYELIYSQLTDYLKSDSTARIKMEGNKELIEWVITCNSQEYRFITEEILAFLSWLKRFAEGMIEVEEGEEE